MQPPLLTLHVHRWQGLSRLLNDAPSSYILELYEHRVQSGQQRPGTFTPCRQVLRQGEIALHSTFPLCQCIVYVSRRQATKIEKKQ